jgi:hypothetical protein
MILIAKNQKPPRDEIILWGLNMGTFQKLLIITSSRRLEVRMLHLLGYAEKQLSKKYS